MNPAHCPTSVEEIRESVCSHSKIIPVGNNTKTAMSSSWSDDFTLLPMSGLSGVVEYEPTEYTITVRSGTTLQELASTLAEHAQYLPFDPPWVDAGATIGGTVAAGLSGSGRVRYGGLRDFILGVELIDGSGTLVRGGGKVVKNAAGFDLPRLVVGSAGRLGVITELTFKAFPKAEQHLTIVGNTNSLAESVEALYRMLAESFDIEAIDIESDGTMLVRLAGEAKALAPHADRIARRLECVTERIDGQQEQQIWDDAREFRWITEDTALIKIPITPARICEVDTIAASAGVARKYSGAGNVCWLAWPRDQQQIAELDRQLSQLDLRGLVVRGDPCPHLLGRRDDNLFATRIKEAMDEPNRFGELM